MGSSKRSQKNIKQQVQLRSRTTRSSKGRLVSDPAQNTQLLTEQLRSLGLYAAPTLGDGNCLFRALSDQLYGTPSHHMQLRKDICDWIEAHKHRYEPFVEDERGLQVHLQCMRENATYGGHMELSAFAHLARRDVKVIQPGLVYVIQHDAGSDTTSDQAEPVPSTNDSTLDDREKRRARRDKKRAEKEMDAGDPVKNSEGNETVYVAYHDWEHFSSIRNLQGPHSGTPHINEMPPNAELPVPSPRKRRPVPKVKLKLSSAKTSNGKLEDPVQIPLPTSRSSSLLSDNTDSDILPSFPPTTTITPSTPSLYPSGSASLATTSNLRVHCSPKRSFDESSGSGSSESSVAKRTRSSTARSKVSTNIDPDVYLSTPGLSAPGSSSSSTDSSSSSSSSSASSPVATPVPESVPEPKPKQEPRPLTRRQRKALGLPKPRETLLAKKAGTGGLGKIVIPGGKYKKVGVRAAREDGDGVDGVDGDEEDVDADDAEWRRNGTGRVDVRGFRELKI